MIPFLAAIKFLSLEIMADALVISRNFLYFLFDINVIVPDLPLSIADTPFMISLGSPTTKPSITLAISERVVKTINQFSVLDDF